MNDHDRDPAMGDALFDRIVDGGMSPEDLRAAVGLFERHADGWKRCAIAFLEAQALGESFRGLGQRHSHEPAGQTLASSPAPARKVRPDRWLRPAAAAAMVAASFALGWTAHGTRVAAPPKESLAGNPGATVPIQAGGLAASQSSAPVVDAAPEDRPVSAREHGDPAPEPPSRAIRTVGRIRFGPENARAEVPVLAGPGFTEKWLVEQPPPVPEHGKAALERQGYQVDQQRRFLMVTLADGRRVAVPVDHVQIQYRGSEPL
jgi:hypothetical protein